MEGTYLPVNYAGIPKELLDYPNFVLWHFNNNGTKSPPINPRNGELAYTNKPETWGTLAQAQAQKRRFYHGIGFVLTPDTGITVIDIDHVVTRDRFTRDAQDIVDSIGSYAELSPSGTGVHIWAYGHKPSDRSFSKRIEMYDAEKYLTITGHRVELAPATIEYRQEEIDRLYYAEFPVRPVVAPAQYGNYRARSDAGVIDAMSRAMNANRSMPLWDGDTSGFDGDKSKADFQLAKFLMFFSYGDVEQADRLFRESGLMREKWDSKRGSTTYGELTMNNAYNAWKQNQA